MTTPPAAARRWTVEILRAPGHAASPERVVVWDDDRVDDPPNPDELVGQVVQTNQAIVIRTGWTVDRGYLNERHVPWHQVRDFRAETFTPSGRLDELRREQDS